MSFILIVITPACAIKDEVRSLELLFARGLQTLHVRKPEMSFKELREYLARIPSRYHPRIVIHSHYRLLNEFKLRGLHLTEKTRRKRLPPYFNRARHTLSASFHSIADLKKTRREYDYVFLAPVFDSISKAGYRSGFSAEELKLPGPLNAKIIALGGISAYTVPRIRALNFAGAAALGFVWESKDPLKAYLSLRSKIQ